MGRFFRDFFRSAGLSVSVEDPKLGPVDWQSAGSCDVVLLATSLSAVEEAARRLGPFTRPNGAVIDIASLKASPLRAMLRHCRGAVVGSHPFFGPTVGSLRDRLVFICPGRGRHWTDWYRTFLEERGARVVPIVPEHHDKLMATVQTLRHLLLIFLGRTLMRTDFDVDANLPLSGEWFSLLVDMLTHQMCQEPDLYAQLAVRNPYVPSVLDAFEESVKETIEPTRAGDAGRLIDVMNELRSYVRPGGKPTD